MLAAASQAERRGSSTLAILAGLFVVSFLIPLGVGLQIGGLWASAPQQSDETNGPFAQTIPFGPFTHITGSSDVTPKVHEDFLLLGWFKIRRFPSNGERLLLVSKYERADGKRPG